MIENNSRKVNSGFMPPVVLNLIIINVIVFFSEVMLQERFGIDLTAYLALFNPRSDYFSFHQLFTHVFMHGDITHLLSNMFSLWLYGVLLENFWGPKRFLFFYMFTAIGAALLHLAVGEYEINQLSEQLNMFMQNPTINDFIALLKKDPVLALHDGVNGFVQQWRLDQYNPDAVKEAKDIAQAILQRKINTPTVGASGAVFGLMLGAALLFPNTIRFPLFLPLKYIAIIHGIEELMYGLANNPSDNVAHFAHLGGMLFGYILIKYWNKKNRHTFY